VYLMRTILHDWSDERATDILGNTRAAIGTGLAASFATPRKHAHVSAPPACVGFCSGLSSSGADPCTGTSNSTLALLELAPADGLRERFEGFVYMDVQMLTVCDGMERSTVRIHC
jgi:hypothetical protein